VGPTQTAEPVPTQTAIISAVKAARLWPTREKRGCAQCAHPGLRIGSYRFRTGPDWRCLRGSGGNSRAGTRFESHLGHVFSLFRGLWSSECVQISFYGPLRGPIFVVGCCFLAAPLLAWTAVLLLTPAWPGAPGTA